MNISEAQYIIDGTDPEAGNSMIKATDGGIEIYVPILVGNRHYDEIMRQVNEGTLTIADAE